MGIAIFVFGFIVGICATVAAVAYYGERILD
jgi:hypothetical protein